jgi:hypothetical protein
MRVCVIILLVILGSCNVSKKEESISFDSILLDLGKVEYGGKVDMHYRFKNETGKSISISQVIPGCDCTIINGYDSAAIDDGEYGEINVSYDTRKGIIGVYRKDLRVVFANVKDSVYSLYYTGIVTGNK